MELNELIKSQTRKSLVKELCGFLYPWINSPDVWPTTACRFQHHREIPKMKKVTAAVFCLNRCISSKLNSGFVFQGILFNWPSLMCLDFDFFHEKLTTWTMNAYWCVYFLHHQVIDCVNTHGQRWLAILSVFPFAYLEVGIYFDDIEHDSLPTIKWQFIFEIKV